MPGIETLEMTKRELVEREKVIERGKSAFFEVGTALAEIRERRGYRFEFNTFEDYCKTRWGWSQQNAHYYIDAATVVKALPAETSRCLEVSQAAALAKLVKPSQKGNGAKKEIDFAAVRQVAAQIDFGTTSLRQVETIVDERRRAEKRERARAALAEHRATILPPTLRVEPGDCLDVLPTLDPESVHLVVTSPPYPGVPELWGAFFAPDNFAAAHVWLDAIWAECIRVLKPGGKMCINIGNTQRRPYLPNAARVALYQNPQAELIGEIIWHQGAESSTAWGTYANPTEPALCDVHEHILIFRKKGKRESPLRHGPILENADFVEWRNSVWTMAPASAKQAGHPAPFPLELPRRLILFYTFPGETVLDPFLGSGTTLRAALDLERCGIGIEKDAESFALAKRNLSRGTP